MVYRHRLDAVLDDLATRRPPPTRREMVSQLEIPHLMKQSEGDSIAARSAQRRLESAFVHLAFYAPRRFDRAGDHPRAALSLQLATEIKPDHWRAWYALATAQAGAGRKSKAVAALQRAIDAGYSDLSHIENDRDLDPIRGEEGYRRIVEALRTR